MHLDSSLGQQLAGLQRQYPLATCSGHHIAAALPATCIVIHLFAFSPIYMHWHGALSSVSRECIPGVCLFVSPPVVATLPAFAAASTPGCAFAAADCPPLPHPALYCPTLS